MTQNHSECPNYTVFGGNSSSQPFQGNRIKFDHGFKKAHIGLYRFNGNVGAQHAAPHMHQVKDTCADRISLF
jgi:hypothetical protein